MTVDYWRSEVERLSLLNTRSDDPAIERALAEASRQLGEALLRGQQTGDMLQEALMWLSNAATGFSNAGDDSEAAAVLRRVTQILGGLPGGPRRM